MPIADDGSIGIASGSGLTLTATGKFGGNDSDNTIKVMPSGRARYVMNFNFSALGGTTPTARFFVVVSYDGGTTWKRIACSAKFQSAALSGGDATAFTSVVTTAGVSADLGLDAQQKTAGNVKIPFDFDHGRKTNTLVGLYVELAGTSPTVTVDQMRVDISLR